MTINSTIKLAKVNNSNEYHIQKYFLNKIREIKFIKENTWLWIKRSLIENDYSTDSCTGDSLVSGY